MSRSIDYNNSYVLSPQIASSQYSNTAGIRSSLTPAEQAAFDVWTFSRARTEKEHAAFREKLQFQSADFHDFLYKTAKNSPQIAVPSPSWEAIPFPVPARSPVTTERSEGRYMPMNAAYGQAQNPPVRRPTPIDFGTHLERPANPGLDSPVFNFDRISYYDGAQYRGQDALITVGAVFEVGPRSSMEITPAPPAIGYHHTLDHQTSYTRAPQKATGSLVVYSDIEMVTFGGSHEKDHDVDEDDNRAKTPFAWVRRQFTKLS